MSRAAIRIIDETGSTNVDLAQRVREGLASEGDWWIARRQTAGKGRQGREWFDGSGNFMGSTPVAIRPGDPPPASLSFVTALAVYDTVEEALAGAAHPALKWPNDVLIASAKLSGILLEMVGAHVVVGIGVNLARAPQLKDRKTAALSDYSPAPGVEWFASRLADCFALRLAHWRDSGLAPTLAAFQLCSIHTPGSRVTVHDQDGSYVEGAFAGLEENDGAMRLRLADGSERVIRAGDIL